MRPRGSGWRQAIRRNHGNAVIDRFQNGGNNMIRIMYAAMILLAGASVASAQNPADTSQRGSTVSNIPSDVVKDLAPTGTLRAGTNLGNMGLAQTDEKTGEPKGITVDLARELGRRLGGPVELVRFNAAGKTFEGPKGGAQGG